MFKTIAGLTLILINIVVVFLPFNTWLDRDQWAFHVPLIVLFFLLIRKNMSFLVLGIICWFSYYLSWNGIIDEKIYELLFESTSSFGANNPQYIKLFLYAIVLIIYIPFLFKRSWRSQERVFAFLSGVACLCVTFIIHFSIVQNSLNTTRDDIKREVGSFVQLDFSENDFLSFCFKYRAECYYKKTEEEIRESFKGKVNFMLGEMIVGDKGRSHRTFENGYFRQYNWIRQIVGVKKENEFYTVIIEEFKINNLQKQQEKVFGILGFYAHFIWGIGLILIGLAHKSPKRQKVFDKT